MAYTKADIEANRRFFADKIRAEKEIAAVYHRVKGEPGGGDDFLLLDVRRREDYEKAHIPGAWCTPLNEFEQWIGRIPKDRPLVAYCYNYT